MFIKYQNNIYNISNYYSVTRSGDKFIHLTKENNDHYSALPFNNSGIRDTVLASIWDKLIDKADFFDIDSIIDTINDSSIFNL